MKPFDVSEPPRCSRCSLFVRRGVPCEVCELRDARGTRSAIRQFLEFGEKSVGQAHGGYFSPGGWAYETLKRHLDALGEPTLERQIPPPLKWWQVVERARRWRERWQRRHWRIAMGDNGGMLVSWRKRDGAA